MGRSGHVRADTQHRAGPEPARWGHVVVGWDRSWRAGTGRGGLGQVVVGWDRSWWAGTGRGGFGGGHFGCLAGCVWGGLSEGRLGCAARQDVSVPGCWPGQAFTPETGRPAAAGADTSCRAARPSLQRHPISLRPADPARSGRHRGGPHRELLQLGGARAGGGGIGAELRDLGHPLESSDRLCLVRGPRYLCEVAADPAAGPGPETGHGGRDLGQDVVRAPGTQTSPLSRSTPGRRSPTHRAGVGQALR